LQNFVAYPLFHLPLSSSVYMQLYLLALCVMIILCNVVFFTVGSRCAADR